VALGFLFTLPTVRSIRRVVTDLASCKQRRSVVTADILSETNNNGLSFIIILPLRSQASFDSISERLYSEEAN
jgi:hypothetical protein